MCTKVIASCLFLHRESSEYSDWVGDAGVSLQPPKRKSKRQVKRRKLSSSEDDEEVEVVDDDDDDNYDEDSTRDSARSSSSRRQQPKRKKPPPPTRKKPSKNKRVRNHFRWPNRTNHQFPLVFITCTYKCLVWAFLILASVNVLEFLWIYTCVLYFVSTIM